MPKKILANITYRQFREKIVGKWYGRMIELTKCDMYSLYKVKFEMEKYLADLNESLAIPLCKFRTSNHLLEVEKLRYIEPLIPKYQRICNKCNLQVVRNEFHNLLVCPAQIN